MERQRERERAILVFQDVPSYACLYKAVLDQFVVPCTLPISSKAHSSQ